MKTIEITTPVRDVTFESDNDDLRYDYVRASVVWTVSFEDGPAFGGAQISIKTVRVSADVKSSDLDISFIDIDSQRDRYDIDGYNFEYLLDTRPISSTVAPSSLDVDLDGKTILVS